MDWKDKCCLRTLSVLKKGQNFKLSVMVTSGKVLQIGNWKHIGGNIYTVNLELNEVVDLATHKEVIWIEMGSNFYIN